MVESEIKISHLLVENFGAVRRITFANPRKNNAYNLQTYREMTACLNASDRDDSVRVVVLTSSGSGGNYYCSGNDVSDIIGSGQQVEASGRQMAAMVKAFYKFSKLLVCVISGPAIGIGVATAVLCDVVYMLDTAYLQTPFTAAGLAAEGCASYTFPKLMGNSKASEMLLLNYRMPAREALQLGVVSQLFNHEQLDHELWPRIMEFGTIPIGSVRLIKQQIKRFELEHLERANTREMDMMVQRLQSKECLDILVNLIKTKSKI